jgi:hypothetical protein
LDIITGDNYEGKAGSLFDQILRCKVNIFNISRIKSEVRGGKAPRIKRLSEYIGESYFEYLANLKDLVLINVTPATVHWAVRLAGLFRQSKRANVPA